MTAIVEDLLLLARSDSGAVALERVPSTSATSRPTAPRRWASRRRTAGVRVEVDPEPAVVAGDPARLRQLVMILVDNAIRHSPADGRVGVAVRARRDAAHRWWSRTTGPGSGPRTCRTSSSASTGRPARRAAAPASGLAIATGSSTATAAGSRSPTGPRAGPASWSACRRPAGVVGLRRCAAAQLAGEPSPGR